MILNNSILNLEFISKLYFCSRVYDKLSDETYTYLNPQFDQVDGLVEKAIDDCEKHFQRYKWKWLFVVKFNHATRGTTNCFILANNFKNQYEELYEAKESGNKIGEIEQRESGYIFDTIKKITLKMFRCHDIKASIYCK